jgi:RNA polymerase sigma factor (sigma-70 family)
MYRRQETLEIFSTFLQFDADRFQGWATEPRLRRSMQSCLSQLTQSEISENFWGLYWYNIWQTQTNRLAQDHLSAYLQEVCYWAAQKAATAIESAEYRLPDCFQVAIAHLNKVLQGFDAKRNLSLKGYASLKFGSVIKDTLRQRKITDICTPWALLNKLSKKRFIESLLNVGLGTETIQRYVLAWTCFTTLYTPTEVPTRTTTTRKLVKPGPEMWAAIANLYNQQHLTQLPSRALVATPEELEKWLTDCAIAARQYLYPSLTSMNAPKAGQEDGELLDDLPATQLEPAFSELMAEEEKVHAQQINAVLLKAINQLEPQLQQLLHLYYVQGLTQQQIAQQLQIQQYNVSRQLTRVKRSLQRRLTEWSQETLHISPNLDVLESISTALEEWLNVHYGQRAV